MTTRAVNFEFPVSRFAEALGHLTTNGLIEPVGLHLHSTAKWSNDSETQCCATAWTKATDDQWTEFCKVFNQDCVAIATELYPNEPYPTAGVCIGPKPWDFEPGYFVIPKSAPLIKLNA